MKLQKLVSILFISSLVILSGCSAKHAANSYDNAGGPDGAQVAGLGEGENFGDDGMNGGRVGRNRSAHNNTYYFEYDSNAIHDDDKPSIYHHANQLANSNKHVIVEGHTDPRGSREYNIALGERRANAVADLMKSKGVSSRQVRVVSYGAERPASQGHTEQDYQLDRRAHITGQG